MPQQLSRLSFAKHDDVPLVVNGEEADVVMVKNIFWADVLVMRQDKVRYTWRLYKTEVTL
jgi:hypothetical protein